MRYPVRMSLLAFTAISLVAFLSVSSNKTRAKNDHSNISDGTVTCVVPPPGMVGWWPGEGNADDIRGENNGVLNGATIAAGEVGHAFSFNGSSEVTVTDNGNLNLQNFTIDAWVFPTVVDGENDMIVSKEDSTDTPYELSIRGTAGAGGSIAVGNLAFFIGGISGLPNDQNGWVDGGGAVPLNTWTHVALTFDGSSAKTYINGVLKRTVGGLSGNVYVSSGSFRIGSRFPGELVGDPNARFNGSIDELEVFSRALDITETASIFNAGSLGKCRPRCSPPPSSGMVSWWDGDDSPFDRKGTNHGAMPPSGAGFGAGKVGRSFTFDNSQNPVSVPDNSSLDPQTLTIDAWVFPTTLDGAQDIIVNKEVPGTVQYEMSIKGSLNIGGSIPFGHLAVFVGGLSGLPNEDNGWVDGGGVVPLNTWSHVAMTFDGSTLSAYVNGVKTRQVTGLSGTVPSSTGPFRIGARNPNVGFATDPFKGSIDEVEFFNRALSGAELQAINNAAHAGKCKQCLAPPAGMVGWWNGDANSNDSSGNGNNGTLNGGMGYAIGRVGQSFSFDGVDDFVGISNNSSLDIGTGDVTVDLWVNLNTLATDQELFHKVSGSGSAITDPSYFIEFDQPNALRFRIGDGSSGVNDLIVPTTLVTGVWYHVAAVRSGNTNVLYLNGNLIGSQTAGSNIDTGTGGSAVIGKCLSSGGCVRFVKGRIDEVEVFNRALSTTEIQSIVAAGVSGKCKIASSTPVVHVGDATINYPNGAGAGNTTYETHPVYQAGPMNFGVDNPLHVADIATTVALSGTTRVCFNLQAPEFTAAPFTQLRIYHQEGNLLVNRTSISNPSTGTLCADVGSFSQFVIAKDTNAPTAAPATIAGRVTNADGSAAAGVTIDLAGGRSGQTITDTNGNYHFDNLSTDSFYSVTPSRLNYHFDPANRSFSLVANNTDAVFTALPDSQIVGNVIDTPDYFVRQHYLDFLGREPDPGGLDFWTNQIRECGSDAACVELRTINVSAAYFLSIEFQQTGAMVDGLYRVSYGRAPRFAEFTPDAATVAQGVVVGNADWAQRLAANKRAFLDAWVQRAEFQSAYGGVANGAYVDMLISHTGISFTQAERDALVTGLNSNSVTRAEVLGRIAENERFVSAKRNETFVMMEYFGYLRRDPDASGYQFWLNKLNQFDGNFEAAEMVKAFIVSGEYRARFVR